MKYLECRSLGKLYGQIKGWSNNVLFMESHHGSMRKRIPLYLYYIYPTHPMYKRFHAAYLCEARSCNGFVCSTQRICVDDGDGHRGVAVYRMDWKDNGGVGERVLLQNNV